MARYAQIKIGQHSAMIEESIRDNVQLQLDALLTTAMLLGWKTVIKKDTNYRGDVVYGYNLQFHNSQGGSFELKLSKNGIYLVPYLQIATMSTNPRHDKIKEALKSNHFETQVEQLRYVF